MFVSIKDTPPAARGFVRRRSAAAYNQAMVRSLLALFVLLLPVAAQQAPLLILHKGASSLGFYTLEGTHLATVPVGRHPHEMVRSADGRFLYTTDNGTMMIEQAGAGGNTVSIVDLTARKKVGEISLGDYRRPHGIDLDPQSGLLYVSCELPDQLLAIDPKLGKVVRTYATQGKTAHMVKLGPGARWAYVSHSSSANVGAVELATGRVRLIPTGARPEGSALSPDGKLLYVVNREAAQITVIDTGAQSAIGAIPTGKGPVRVQVTPDGELVYALMHDQAVGIADAKSRRQLAAVALGGSPVSLALSPDGTLAYAAAQDLDTIYVVSVRERKLLRQFQTAPKMFPDAILALK
jgi:YVTN family beta-propeller protein